MRETIELLVACGRYSDIYADFLIENCLQTRSGNHDLKFFLGINNYPQFDMSRFEKYKQHVEIEPVIIPSDTCNGSEGHAIVLNTLFSKATQEHCMTVDCDIAFLTRNWDQKLLDMLKGNVVIAGTSYNITGNFAKYLDFPSVLGTMYCTKIWQDLKIDFATIGGPYTIPNNEEANWYKRPIGSVIWRDTGYQIPILAKKNGYDGAILTYKQLPTQLGVGQEHWHENAPFLTHLKGSSERPAGDNTANQWMGRVRSFVSNLK